MKPLLFLDVDGPLIPLGVGREPAGQRDQGLPELDRAWVAQCHPGPALLHRVEPHLGLTDRDFDVVGRWLSRCC